MRRLRRLLPYLAVGLVVAGAAAVLWRAGPLRQHARAAVTTELSRQLSRRVEIGDLRIGLTGRVVIRDLEVQNLDGSPLLRAPEASVRLGSPLALFSRPAAAVRGITLRRPEIRLVRDSRKRWSIEDLLRRKAGQPRFTGEVAIEQGRLIVLDQARGGLATALHDVNLALKQPQAGEGSFSLRARGAEDAFDSLEAKGRFGPKAGLTRASIRVADLDLGYAFARLPEVRALSISAGRAELKGELARAGAGRDLLSALRLEAEVKGGEVSFPWLRQPVTDVQGTVVLEDGVVHLEGIEGAIAGAPVTAEGSITGYKDPRLDLDIRATGVRYPQLRALVRNLYLPLSLALPAPLRITARVEGPASNVTVEGRADVRVVKFRLVPWHDVVATFAYQDHKLKVRNLRAHGSPRRLEGELEVTWGASRELAVAADFTLSHVPADLLARMLGIQLGDIHGIASLTGKAQFDGGQSLIADLVVRQVSFRGVPLGEVRGQLELADGVVAIRRLRLVGPAARGEVTGRVSLSGRYQLEGRFSSLDFSTVGPLLGRPDLTGHFPATIRASGTLAGPRAAGELEIGPGQLAGRAFQFVRAGFEVSPGRLRLKQVTARLPQGELLGSLEIGPWRGQVRQAPVAGRFSFADVDPADWLPPRFAALVAQDRVTGEGEVGGALGSPWLRAELELASPSASGLLAPVGRARVRYQAGAFFVDELDVSDDHTGLQVRGSATPAALSLTATGDDVDLGGLALLAGRPGLQVSGRASVRALLTGSWSRPRLQVAATSPALTVVDSSAGLAARGDLAVEFTWRRADAGPDVRLDLTCEELRVSGRDAPGVGEALRQGTAEVVGEALRLAGMPLSGVAVCGTLTAGVLTIHRLEMNQGGSRLSASGRLDLRPSLTGPVDLTVGLFDVDLFRAIWRLDRAGFSVYRLVQSRGIPRLTSGRLNDTSINGPPQPVHITGTLGAPQVEFPLALDQLAFDGGRIERIRGGAGIGLDLTPEAPRRVTAVELDITATHDPAIAKVQGTIQPEGEVRLSASIENLGLAVLAPWLRNLAALEALPIAGEATIYADVSGSWRQPELIGTVDVTGLQLGPLKCESARAYPIRLVAGTLRVEEVSFRNGPTTGVGELCVPLFHWLGRPSADLKIERASLAPVEGMEPFVFDANLHLRGQRLYLTQEAPQPGQAPSTAPGVRGRAGRGAFVARGELDLAYLSPETRAADGIWATIELDDAQLSVPDVVDGSLSGRLELRHNPETGRPVLMTPDAPEPQPLVLSHAVLGLPRGRVGLAPGAAFRLPLDLAVQVSVGEEVRFRYGAGRRPTEIVLDPCTSSLTLGGPVSAEGVRVEAEAHSQSGVLSFPNGSLTLRQGMAQVSLVEARELREVVSPGLAPLDPERYAAVRPSGGWVEPKQGEKPTRSWRVWVSAEADGRVGDYYVSMRPVGQVYPPAPEGQPGYDLNVFSIPPLEQAYVLALLAGPTVAPVRGGRREMGELLAGPGESRGGGELTGVALPPVGGLGMPELSLDVAFGGPTRVRIGERLFQRVFVSYLSPISGPASRSWRVTYQVRPRLSLGWGLDELDRVQWEVQSFMPF